MFITSDNAFQIILTLFTAIIALLIFFTQESATKGIKKFLKIICGLILFLCIIVFIWSVKYFRKSNTNNTAASSTPEKVSESSSITSDVQNNTSQTNITSENTAQEPNATAKDTASPENNSKANNLSGDISVSINLFPTVEYDKLPQYQFQSATATSHLVQDSAKYNQEYDNRPQMAIDNDLITSWQEGVDGYGYGEELHLSFESEKEVQHLVFWLGNWRATDVWERNSMPTILELDTDDNHFTLNFSSGQSIQYLDFSEPIVTKNMKFTIIDVRQGQDQDTCITEIKAYGV